jgi:molecular chaperone GrpE (heat shock protein)
MRCPFQKFFKCNARVPAGYISHLVDAVNKLLAAIGEKPQTIHPAGTNSAPEAMQTSIETVKRIARGLETKRSDNEATAAELKRVASNLTAVKSELNDSRENAKTLERQVNELENALSAAKTETNMIKDTLMRTQAEIETVKDELSKAEKPVETTSVPDNKQGYQGLALSLIIFRDQLLYFQDNFRDDGNEPAVKMLGTLYKETGRFMGANGIEPLEETGGFDEQKHIAADTKSTSNPELNNAIESTFRPGYRINGELYRPQEVVVYMYRQ